MHLGIYFTYAIKCHPSIFVYSSSFLGSVQWKLDKQLKDSGIHSILHNASMFKFLENASTNLFDKCNKVLFPNFGMANANSSSFLGSVQLMLDKQFKDCKFFSIYIM